ncbi:MAG: hypothetical protein WDM78_11815 [Puia sp.]
MRHRQQAPDCCAVSKDVQIPTILITIAYWVIGLPFGWVFAFHFHMGAAGMWLGLIVGLTLASYFFAYGLWAGSDKLNA